MIKCPFSLVHALRSSFNSTSVIITVLSVRVGSPLGLGLVVREVFRQDEFELVQFFFRDVLVRSHQGELHRSIGGGYLSGRDGFVDVREDRGGDVFREGCVGSESLHHFLNGDRLRVYPPCVVVGAARKGQPYQYKMGRCERSSVDSRSANESVAKFMKNEKDQLPISQLSNQSVDSLELSLPSKLGLGNSAHIDDISTPSSVHGTFRPRRELRTFHNYESLLLV